MCVHQHKQECPLDRRDRGHLRRRGRRRGRPRGLPLLVVRLPREGVTLR
ncbi:Variant-specific surface protein [Giardia duodenalis assemblage B]|uniref:Variant-specific surface protein n=1 Tax=Giardia duodenalis assemblage B TaxID=1394984 RepID=A0A132NM64_GIAIN|nr:Variant-specific surface protein [Giardia intestinalis assemblage B]